MFHRVVTEYAAGDFHPNGQFSVTPEVLADVIASLRHAGYEIVSLDEVHRRLTQGGMSRRFACLTFDDGYRDNYEVAYPVCAQCEAPMTTYVTTGLIDGTAPAWWYGVEELVATRKEVTLRCGEIDESFATRTLAEKLAAYEKIASIFRSASRPLRDSLIADIKASCDIDILDISSRLVMDWETLREFDRQPGVEIGAHSLTHRALKSLSEDDARHEMAESRRLLETTLGHPVRHFAYPHGDSSTTGDREARICRDLGFATATTTRHGALRRDSSASMFTLPRIPTDPFDSGQTIAVKLSGLPSMIQRVRRRFRR